MNTKGIGYYAIIIFILILYSNFNSYFEYVNGFMYDKVVSSTLTKPLKKKPILLIELSKEDLAKSSNQWEETLTKILKLKPKSFIFLTKTPLNQHMVKTVSQKIPTYISSSLKQLQNQQQIYKVSQDNNKYLKENIAYIAPPHSNGGVYRYYDDNFDTDIGQVLSLPKKIAQEFSDNKEKLNGRFYINFNHQPTLPVISLTKLLDSASIEEIVKNKHIIFGYKKRDLEASLTIPFNNTNISISEFFAYSLLTLLQDNQILYLNGYLNILVILLFLFFGILAHTLFKISFRLTTIFIGILLVISVSWLLLNYYSIWIPAGEISIWIIIISYIGIWYKEKQNSEKTNRLLIASADKMKDRISHKTFFNSADYWKYIATLITQTLNINKIIFLEKVESEHRLFEIEAVNCSLDDIKELRRDYEREPYKSAIEKKEAIKLEQREFFKDLADDESQYMVPLIYSGQVMGFWAFTIDKHTVNEQNDFSEILTKYSYEISALLYQRYEWRERSKSKGSILQKFANIDSNFIIMKIKSTFTMLEKRLNMLETVINRYDNGVILYDMFGRVYHINKKMEKLLTNAGLLPFKITSEEMILNLCKLSEHEATQVVRDIILNKYHFTYKVKLDINDGGSFLLKASALSKDDLGDNFNDTFFFDNYGVLIELIDISSYKEQLELKNEVINEANKNIKNILSSITLSLQDNNSTIESNKNLESKFASFLFAYNKMEDIVSQDIFFGSKDYYPVNIISYLQRSFSSLKEMAEESYVNFDIIGQKNLSLAFVNPITLEYTIIAFLKYLINDAVENSKVTIELNETSHDVIITMRNEGFGLPKDKFKELLKDNHHDDKLLKELKNAILDIQKVHGDVESSSSHGKGIKFIISLNRYQ